MGSYSFGFYVLWVVKDVVLMFPWGLVALVLIFCGLITMWFLCSVGSCSCGSYILWVVEDVVLMFCGLM